jgi:hypothetical protein
MLVLKPIQVIGGLPFVTYLRDPSIKVDKNVRRSTFKFILHNGELYRRTAEDLLLKSLDDDQAKVAMGAHQSAPKMK